MKTKVIKVGDLKIGGGNPVIIQSMTTTKTDDTKATLLQINELYKAGCKLVRVAVPDEKSAYALKELCENSPVPLVADIHFNYKLALIAVDNGISKIRINPGNIGSDEGVKLVAEKCKEKNIPIRIGVNSGSVDREILAKYGGPTAEALVDSAFKHINLLKKYDFDNICVSIKSSNVSTMMRAYMLMSEKSEIPLHLGVTEAGTKHMGTLKSACGIGGLLALGIGDTIRVSLTANPCEEIEVALDILKALDMNNSGVNVVSCPTCGRCNINLIEIASQVEEKMKNINKKMTVAVMGCVVNGPGEAREADFGLAGGNGKGILFKKGEVLKTVNQDVLVDELYKLVCEEDFDETC